MSSFSDKLDEVLANIEADSFYEPLHDENGKHWGNQEHVLVTKESLTGTKEQIIKLVLDEVIGEDEVIPLIPAGGDARYVDEYQKAYRQLKFGQRKKLLDESKQGDHK